MLAAVAVMLMGDEPGHQGRQKQSLPQRAQRLFSPDGDQLAEVQVVLVDLGDEDGRHGLVQSRPIHVDGGAHWQHEASYLPVDSTVLQETLHGDGQSG